jgi:hypothetical protein
MEADKAVRAAYPRRRTFAPLFPMQRLDRPAIANGRRAAEQFGCTPQLSVVRDHPSSISFSKLAISLASLVEHTDSSRGVGRSASAIYPGES